MDVAALESRAEPFALRLGCTGRIDLDVRRLVIGGTIVSMRRSVENLVLARVPDQERTRGVGRGLNEIVLRVSARAANGIRSRKREIEKSMN